MSLACTAFAAGKDFGTTKVIIVESAAQGGGQGRQCCRRGSGPRPAGSISLVEGKAGGEMISVGGYELTTFRNRSGDPQLLPVVNNEEYGLTAGEAEDAKAKLSRIAPHAREFKKRRK